MGIWRGVRRAAKATLSPAPGGYAVCGKRIRCDHCGNMEFKEGSAQLNTAGMTFLGLDWANRTATTLMCAACGRIQWYGQRPDRIETADGFSRQRNGR